ncbi:MAG TPA: glycine/betaine ABC transporter [Ruminococcaceae bacterium]|nr:glycine/betaine ABC transporter [Oscillospiraceae bacterium]
MRDLKRILALLVSVMLTLGVITGCSGGKADTKTVKLGYVNWAEGVAMTHLVAAVLEDKMGYEVETTMADVAPIFTSVASGNTDAFLDVWLPVTHEEYLKEYGDDLIDLSVINGNARIGLVVPSYVNISSIEELNGNKDLFDGKIIGIDSGAGIMGAAERAIDEYDMDLELMTGSEAAMTASLRKAIDDKKPVVVTGWAPHWKFARWDLKFLDDSKGTFGATEEIHCITRKGLAEDMPEVSKLLENFKMSDSELGDLMGAVEDSDKEPLEAARDWMNKNTDFVDSILPN